MKPASITSITRRRFLKHTAAAVAVPLLNQAGVANTSAPQQATGTRVGEVTDSTAVVWARLTREAERNNKGVEFPKRAKEKSVVTIPVEQIEGACPGAPGQVRVRYGLKADFSDAVETKWTAVSADTDFIHQIKLAGLKAGSTYHYFTQASPVGGEKVGHEFRGKFHTAPDAGAHSNFRFCVMTCQGYQDRDHQDGHPIYPSMQMLDPKFIAMTGDVVYYDSNEPKAVNPTLARLHWERMFSLPRLIAAMRSTSTYWLKDDHDTLSNDCWPGMSDGELTFAEGMKIFREQAPLGEKDYRTIRWGRDLQVWFTEGRDFRSPNNLPDSPEKTIWGAEQKEWFKRTVKESDATWKLLISPTPIVGPDRKGKNDNHSNEGFTHEGNEIREWIKANVPDNFFVITGDRHWQYHSVHPTTGVQEFSAGPASNSHASGSPGENKEYHKFHRVKGGFLSVELKSDAKESVITFQLRGVDGAVGHEAAFRRVTA